MPGVGDLLAIDTGWQAYQQSGSTMPYANWAEQNNVTMPYSTADVQGYLNTGVLPSTPSATTPTPTAANSLAPVAETPKYNYDPVPKWLNNFWGYDNYQNVDPNSSSEYPPGYEVQKIPTAPEPVQMFSPAPASTPAPASSGINFSGIGDPYSMSSSVSKSQSGLPPQLQALLGSVLGYNAALMPKFNQSLDNMIGLPSMIDNWTKDLVNQYRVSGDDIVNQLVGVANDRAARGIMGGTEANNLRANALYSLVKEVNDRKSAALADALANKIATISATPAAASIPMQLLQGLFNTGQTSNSASVSAGYETDPTAMAKIIASLIQSNY